MRLVRLELCNWDIQANQVVVLDAGVNLLSGENGSGKTSILDAIKVALGVTDLGADRSVDEYLSKRASPFAMIRLVADNGVDPVTRRRPLDGLGRYEKDLATLAVVYEASDDGYQPRWYLLDGDVSPLRAGFDGKPFTRRSDYLDRLDKVGMGKSFRQLLRTPQGQIAGLCGRSPAELFDMLFDFIGGKQALDEWQALRSRFEAEKRTRQDRAEALVRREGELGALKERLENHHRYKGHLDRIDLLERALPVCRHLAARRRVDELTARHGQLVAQRKAAAEAESTARTTASTARERLADLDEARAEAIARKQGVQAEEAATADALVELRTEHRGLEVLRKRVAHLPERDAAALASERADASRADATARLTAENLGDAIRELTAERARLDEGLLTPPEGIDAFRAELRRAEIPHQLLLELVEPPTDADARHALESWLGDLRFAVAVPDVESFVRAVALARKGRFPYHVLAPDIRSPAPEGPHPFLDDIHVRDPRYTGLVRRVLRNVDWLRGPVADTFKGRGTLVDAEGYVLDRLGGRFQGTDRYFLGRDALERRRAEVEAALRDKRGQLSASKAEAARLQGVVAGLDVALAEEAERARWHASIAEHRQLEARIAEFEARLRRIREGRAALEEQLERLAGDAGRLQEELRTADALATTQQRQGAGATRDIEALTPELDAARRAYADADPGELEVPADVAEHASRSTPEGLESELRREVGLVGGFAAAVRDPNLPANVRTLEQQVGDVRGELARLDAQVDEARTAAERAYEQYVSATKRVFRAYFAALREAGTPLGFTLEGGVRPRDDGRFEVDLHVTVGEKTPVRYDSSALSGGQKAALSILMAMTTMRVHGDATGAGFFVVDEPFSASDVHKIQELGLFLDQTGAQYLVSMPTTSDLARCGAWLQAVLTCTKSVGGVDAGGALRLAPPVKCSYVVRNAG